MNKPRCSNESRKSNNQKFFHLGLILLAWTLYGLFFASQSYVRQVYFGRNPDWQNNLAIWLTCAYSWALLTPLILFLARRFPFNRETWLSSLSVHIPASVLFSIAALAVFAGFRMIFGESYSFERFQNLVVDDIHACVLVYFTTLGVNHFVNYLYKPADRQEVKKNRTDLYGDLDQAFNSPIDADKTETKETKITAYAERFSVKENGRIVFVNISEIDLVTSEGNYVKLHTNGRSRLLRETMKAMEQKLDPNVFLRIRRSAIVRIEQIKELHPMFNGEFEIVLKNGTEISSSRRYRKNLDALLNS